MQYPAASSGVSLTLHFIPTRTASAIRLALLLALILMTCGLCSGIDNAPMPQTNPAIIINPAVGPPTTTVSVSGSGFDPYAAVDIYFDLTDLVSVTTNGSGAFGGSLFGGVAIQVPASAVPGTHWITAVERYGIRAAQKSFLVNTDWAEWHYDPGRTGANPYENVLSPATVGNLDLHWSYPIPAASPPAVFGGIAYVTSSGVPGGPRLYAFDAHTGALQWSYEMGGSFISAPAVANVNGVVYVYVGTDDGTFYAFNASTRAVVWSYNQGMAGLYSSPAVVNDFVYGSFSPQLEVVWAFNASTGAPQWFWVHGCAGFDISDAVAVGNGSVYAMFGPTGGPGDYFIYQLAVLDAGSGFGGAGPVGFSLGDISVPSPAVANDALYFAFASTLYGPRWRYDTGTTISSAPVIANGVAYVGSDKTYALDATTGALRWQSTVVGSDYAVANGVLYESGGSTFYALDAGTGALLWQYAGAGFTGPVVTNGTVYVRSDDGNLDAFGLPGRQMAEQFSPPERPNPKALIPDFSLQPKIPTTPNNSQQRLN